MTESGMAALKARLAVIATYIPPDKPLIYLDYPLHLNIGDLLIWLGAEDFLASRRYRIIGRRSAGSVVGSNRGYHFRRISERRIN